MTNIIDLTHETFAALLQQCFTASAVEDADDSVDLILTEVDKRAGDASAEPARTPFSLVFRGPTEPLLKQRVYTLANDTLGSVAIFLVPLGPDQEGMLYEAVFS